MLFEIGRVFSKNRGEVESLAGALFGRTRIPLHGKEEFDLLTAKGILTNLSSSLNLKEVSVASDEVPSFLHPGRGGRILLGAEHIGLLGEIALDIYDLLPACPRVILFELDIDKLYRRAKGRQVFNPLPRFPACKRDLCLLVPIDLPEKEVRKAIRTEAEIEHTLLYDLYQGEQVARGYKSLTYEVSLRAMDRTLTDEEVATIIARIEKRLKKLGVTLRV
jgi:phenylalanyl-tRNA synthetase beta chain